MENESENALVALAAPIDWAWRAPVSLSANGQWFGASERATYRITVPTLPDDVDTLPQNRLRGLDVRLRSGGSVFFVPIISTDQAKALCLRHTMYGSLSEMRAAQKALRTEQQMYQEQEKAGRKPLNVIFSTQNFPRLTWDGNDPLAMTQQLTGVNGIYQVNFDATRRWIVRVMQQGHVTDERCFFSRGIVQMACSVHDKTGRWHGMMQLTAGLEISQGSANAFNL